MRDSRLCGEADRRRTRPDDRRVAPPGARRDRRPLLSRTLGLDRAGERPAGDSRPGQGRQHAYVHRRRTVHDRLQRGGVQLPRASAGAGRQGPALPHAGRHGGRAGRLPGVGAGVPAALQRDVRHGRLGQPGARALPGQGPLRHQAAVRGAAARWAGVCVRSEGAAGAVRAFGRREPEGAGAVLGVSLGAGAGVDLRGGRTAARGPLLPVSGRQSGLGPLVGRPLSAGLGAPGPSGAPGPARVPGPSGVPGPAGVPRPAGDAGASDASRPTGASSASSA